MLITIDQLKEADQRYHTWKDTKGREKLSVSAKKTIPSAVTENNIIGSEKNLEFRKEMIEAMGNEPVDFAYERAIGENDSVYSNFVELIVAAKQKVGRIAIKNGNKSIGFATGFMVSEDLLLTNWHVFRDEASVAQSEVQFFYELDTHGNPNKAISFRLRSDEFYCSNKELDYCFIAVEKMDVSGTVSLASIGYIYLDPALGKLGNEGEESLNIVHHPNGDYKQLSIRENLFTKILPTTIWYQSDTAPGSSGSPVFNDQWQVVALHHMGVAEKNKNGEYLDKKGKVVKPVDGKIEASKLNWIANEGIRISVIVKDLLLRLPDSEYVKKISVPPGNNQLMPWPQVQQGKETYNNEVPKIDISVPAALLHEKGMVQIQIAGGTQMSHSPQQIKIIGTDNYTEEGNEVKKIDKEAAVDFSKCNGYDPKFMGTVIPLPQPKKTMAKQIARLQDGSMELKYFKYSVIHNKVTKMPLISAINVEGNPSKRLDDSKRKDDWLRDRRISLDAQLTDQFYAGSGFDKGHMSRWEDANWATDTDKKTREANALRNGIYTCFYSNACPQVKDLNRAGGVWGQLEKSILENGIKKEAGKLARVTVFNGPIFSTTKDHFYKGVQIPMEFFKIVVWYNDKKKLKATAFKLSQEKLVKGIKFTESFGLLEESLDIDTHEKFLEYQCSIASLTKLCKIDFSHLEKYDTYDASQGEETLLVNAEEEVLSHLKKHKNK